MNSDERRAWARVVPIARRAAGLTQEQVAERADVTRRMLTNWETGESVPQEDKLMRVLDVLGLRDDVSEPEVTAFLARLRPQLVALDPETRADVMTALLKIVSGALEARASLRPAADDDVEEDEITRRRRLADEAELSGEPPTLRAVANKGELEDPGENSI